MPDAPSPSADELADHHWRRRCDVIYRARLSALYHLKRERFFDSLDKASAAVTAVAATAAVGAVLKATVPGGGLELWVSAGVAMLSLIPLVFNPAQKARHHALLAMEFRRLLADCEHAGERWGEEQCNQMAARALEIEAAEPAPLAALVADCQIQLAIGSGTKPPARLRWHEKLLKNWVDLRPQPSP